MTDRAAVSALKRAVDNYRTEMLRADADVLRAVLALVVAARGALTPQIAALAAAVAGLEEPTASEVARLPEARTLLAEAERVSVLLARASAQTITAHQRRMVALGADHTRGLAIVGAAGIDAETSARIAARWARADTATLASLVGVVGSGQSVDGFLAAIARAVPRAMTEAINGAVTAPIPGGMADALTHQVDALGSRLLATARTEGMGAYRGAAQAAAIANREIVPRYVRLAIDDGACAACLAVSGNIYETSYVDEFHVGCRCIHSPIVEGAPPPDVETGVERFERFSPEQQDRVLGGRKAGLAYRSGQVTMLDFAVVANDPIWGPSRRQGSLVNALASAAARRRAA